MHPLPPVAARKRRGPNPITLGEPQRTHETSANAKLQHPRHAGHTVVVERLVIAATRDGPLRWYPILTLAFSHTGVMRLMSQAGASHDWPSVRISRGIRDCGDHLAGASVYGRPVFR